MMKTKWLHFTMIHHSRSGLPLLLSDLLYEFWRVLLMKTLLSAAIRDSSWWTCPWTRTWLFTSPPPSWRSSALPWRSRLPEVGLHIKSRAFTHWLWWKTLHLLVCVCVCVISRRGGQKSDGPGPAEGDQCHLASSLSEVVRAAGSH